MKIGKLIIPLIEGIMTKMVAPIVTPERIPIHPARDRDLLNLPGIN